MFDWSSFSPIQDHGWEVSREQENAEFEDMASRASSLWKCLRKNSLPTRVCSEIVINWVRDCFSPYEISEEWIGDEYGEDDY